MERYVCIHGHYYQPPRENPWLEAIELQDSSYPYHDWNERVSAECYAPNSASRILDGENRIVAIGNNYAKMSFNFGPTLLLWMESNAPEVYQAVLDADRSSQERFSGHGSALAQAHNHMLMPLANRRDKLTQIVWGIRDFEHRFGRTPEGMWLPETAVDLETLDIMAEQGIRFTVLAPHQATRVRRAGDSRWRAVAGGSIDARMPYLLHLPSGRTISLFFYDGPISRAVAFESLLNTGEGFAQRLLSAFADGRQDGSQLVHIATDGETYGHHHRFGDMALAYALHYIESNGLARLTNYGEYLENHPPTHEVEIAENTSWSCAHGVERWRTNCGCNSGGHPGWNQEWRAPLRAALDWLRDVLAPAYEGMAKTLLKDPWAARNDYIGVVLDRSVENVERFLGRHAVRELDRDDRTKVLKLLELQRHAMLMYTSCGWFFDDLSGIETVQVIQYAGRAVQLAQDLFGDSIEQRFLELLGQARSNLPEHGDGRRIYDRFVKTAVVDWQHLGAHYAVSSLFEGQGEHLKIHAHTVDFYDYQSSEAGRSKLAVGRVGFTSDVTMESALLTFGVLHFGDHNVNCGVRMFQGEEAYQVMVDEVVGAFKRADLPDLIRLMDKHFGRSTYSLRTLFRDEQRKVLDQIVDSMLLETEAAYRLLYSEQSKLMRFVAEMGIPMPRAFHSTASFFINTDLRRAITAESLDGDGIRALVAEAETLGIDLDVAGLGYALTQTVVTFVSDLASAPEDMALLTRAASAVELAHSLPFEVDLWKAQNLYYRMLQTTHPQLQEKARQGDQAAHAWLTRFETLGKGLSVRVG